MSKALVIPTTREQLEAIDLREWPPAERWNVAEFGDALSELAWPINDDELRRWVEVEGKTQTEIAEQVERSPSAVANRCAKLGLQPKADGRGGRPKKQLSPPDNSNPDPPNDEWEVVDGEVVEGPPTAPGDDRQIDKTHDRLLTTLGAIGGLANGFPDFRKGQWYKAALGGMGTDELREWYDDTKRARKNLRELERDIESILERKVKE